jgi:PD-(D/E)XK nuclease superfamily protein
VQENDDAEKPWALIFSDLLGGLLGLVEHATNTLSGKTIGAAIEVHRHLGPGLLESSYQSCLCQELELRGVRYQSQIELPLEYKGRPIDKAYIIDLLVEDCITCLRVPSVISVSPWYTN